MIVCSCNVLTEEDIRCCLTPGPNCPRRALDVYVSLGCAPQCGQCAQAIKNMIKSALTSADEASGFDGCGGGMAKDLAAA